MFEDIVELYRGAKAHTGRIRRRELREARRWLEDTENLLHISTIVFVPLLIAIVTFVSNVSPFVSFLVYPPLASGTYTLFAEPEGKYSSPVKFVGGITVGSVSGWVAVETATMLWYEVPAGQYRVQVPAAALGIFLTGLATWAFSLEEPTAFSAALLVLVTGSERLAYVTGIVASSILVAGVFSVWRDYFYRRRSQYLFKSTRGDDQVLVPIRGSNTQTDKLVGFAARMAAAHDSGKVVLMKTVSEEMLENKQTQVLEESSSEEMSDEEIAERTDKEVSEQVVDELRKIQSRIEEEFGVPCELAVAVEDRPFGEVVVNVAEEENCDLIVGMYEREDGEPTRYVKTVLRGNTDSILFRPSGGSPNPERVLTMVRSSGRVANALLDFANRLVTDEGKVTACTCISEKDNRRRAESLLDNLVENLREPVETRIAHGTVEEYLERNSAHYDVAFVGGSTDRGKASRIISAPTFTRIEDVECDLAVVDVS